LIELRFQKQFDERRVSLVSATVVQAYLCIGGQFQLAGPTAVIGKRHRAHLGISVWRDANSPTRFDVAVQPTEISPVSLKPELVFISRPAQRLMSNRPKFVVGEVTDVTELTPAIARPIFAPAGDIKAPPRAGSGPSRRDEDPVIAVGEQRQPGRRRVK
jgi:hypothetical protein